MNNDNKFKVSIQSMLDYELPDIAVKFEDYISLPEHTMATEQFQQNY